METRQQQRACFDHPSDSLDGVVVEIFLEIISFVLMIVIG